MRTILAMAAVSMLSSTAVAAGQYRYISIFIPRSEPWVASRNARWSAASAQAVGSTLSLEVNGGMGRSGIANLHAIRPIDVLFRIVAAAFVLSVPARVSMREADQRPSCPLPGRTTLYADARCHRASDRLIAFRPSRVTIP
jgi:hypothetical protein